jgi:hypothetical protein
MRRQRSSIIMMVKHRRMATRPAAGSSNLHSCMQNPDSRTSGRLSLLQRSCAVLLVHELNRRLTYFTRFYAGLGTVRQWYKAPNL